MNFKDARQKALSAVDNIPSQHKKALQGALNDLCNADHTTPVNFNWHNIDLDDNDQAEIYWSHHDNSFDIRMPLSIAFEHMDSNSQVSVPLEDVYDIFSWLFEWSWDKFIWRYAGERFNDLDVFDAFHYFLDKYTIWEVFKTNETLPEIIHGDVARTLTIVPHIKNGDYDNDPAMSFSITRFSYDYSEDFSYLHMYHPNFPTADSFTVNFLDIDIWVNTLDYCRWSFCYVSTGVDDAFDYDAPFDLANLAIIDNEEDNRYYDLPTVINPTTDIDAKGTFILIDDSTCDPGVYLAHGGKLHRFSVTMSVEIC